MRIVNDLLDRRTRAAFVPRSVDQWFMALRLVKQGSTFSASRRRPANGALLGKTVARCDHETRWNLPIGSPKFPASKKSVAILGVDPQLDSAETPGVPAGYTLTKFCCEIIEACEKSIVAVKPQLAFFEARGIEGMRALAEVIRFARGRGLITIADAKRGDIGSTSAAYAEAFLGDGDFASDAITINPYLGADAVMPFVNRIRAGRGVLVLVKNSNPSSGEFQDLERFGQTAMGSSRGASARMGRRFHRRAVDLARSALWSARLIRSMRNARAS